MWRGSTNEEVLGGENPQTTFPLSHTAQHLLGDQSSTLLVDLRLEIHMPV